MPLSRTRDYLSIGEVLEAVRADFPDVSISKIRFLESEGLINPERTSSGYRKFFDEDVSRLRYILALQRDQFLPLKVIRERLAQVDSNGGDFPAEPPAATAPTAPAPAAPAGFAPGAPAPTGVVSGAQAAASPATSGAPPAPDLSGVSLTQDELKDMSGLSDEELAGLMEFGILEERAGTSYDENDLMIATAAQRFLIFGVEPRHLKMYRQFADREATFFEQILTPIARRKDVDAPRRTSESTRELLALSRQIRDAVLKSNLREHL